MAPDNLTVGLPLLKYGIPEIYLYVPAVTVSNEPAVVVGTVVKSSLTNSTIFVLPFALCNSWKLLTPTGTAEDALVAVAVNPANVLGA